MFQQNNLEQKKEENDNKIVSSSSKNKSVIFTVPKMFNNHQIAQQSQCSSTQQVKSSVEYSNIPSLTLIPNEMLKADTNILREEFIKNDPPGTATILTTEMFNDIFTASRNGDLVKLKSLINFQTSNIRDLNGGGSTVSFSRALFFLFLKHFL